MKAANRLSAMLLLFVLWGIALPARAGELDKKLEAWILGKEWIAQIDIPGKKPVEVSPNGQLNRTAHFKALRKHRAIALRGMSGRVVVAKVRRKEIFLKLKFENRYRGEVAIVFQRRVNASDLHPEKLKRALAAVLVLPDAKPAIEARETELFGSDGSDPTPVSRPILQRPQPPPSLQSERRVLVPEISLLSAEALPVRLRPGQSLSLIAHVEISGLARGVKTEVVLERQLEYDGRMLFRNPKVQRVSWANGRHQHPFRFSAPTNAAKGAYTYHLTLKVDGAIQRKKAIFIVE